MRQYGTRFNKELLQVDEAKDQVILTTFQADFLPGNFNFHRQKPTKFDSKIASQSLDMYECRKRSNCERND